MFKRPTFTHLAALAFASTFIVSLSQAAGPSAGRGGKTTDATQLTAVLDFNEETHLVFMREEEKLARDVYTRLGMLYPDSDVFGTIDDSEQRHTDAVKQQLESYGIEDPSTNDNTGVFTGADYGDYFTEKFDYLVDLASASELDALYVGAFIEELDMRDIHRCPAVIVELDNGVESEEECGLDYTDQPDIITLYDSLIEGSENHLRGYVHAIEAIIGEGAYTAQVLTQEEVDEILER